MELALATNIPAREWRAEDDRDIATALDILEKQHAEIERRANRHGRRG